MAGRPPTDPLLVAEALRRVDEGQHRDDVAQELTAEGRPISVATIRRAQAARKTGTLVLENGPPSSKKGAPAAPPAPGRAKGRSNRRPAAKRRPARKAPATAKPLPAPPPIPLLPDTLAELTDALAQTKGHLRSFAGKQGYSAAGNLFDKLLKTKAAIERERRRPGEDLAALLAAGVAALAKIRAGRQVLEQQERERGCCARCGQRLPEAPA